MKIFHISLIIIRITTAMCQILYDPELILELQNHFDIKTILLATNQQGKDTAIRFVKLLTYHTRVFPNVIDLDDSTQKMMDQLLLLNTHKTMIVSNFPSLLMKKLIDVQQHAPLLISSPIWLNFFENYETVEDIVKDLYIPLNCKFLCIRRINETMYEITDVYQIHESSPKSFSIFGYWSKGKLNVFNGYFFSRRTDLKGLHFKIGEDSKHEDFLKEETKFYSTLSECMNFSFSFKPTRVGDIYPNGTIVGMHSLILKHEIDISSTAQTYRKPVIDYFDFIVPTTISEMKMYINWEGKQNWTSYLAPFSTKVWISILGWIITAAVIIHLIARFERRQKRSDVSLDFSAFHILSALCCQGGRLNRSNPSIRILYITPYILGVILTQSYSGVLLSYLTVQDSNPPFQDLPDSIEDGSYKISILSPSALLLYFQTASVPNAVRVRKKNLLVPEDKLPKDPLMVFRPLCDNKWMWIGQPYKIHKVEEKCNIIEIKKPLDSRPLGAVVRKGFPYRDVMTKVMRRLQGGGILKLKKRFIIIPHDNSSKLEPLSIELIAPIFLFYLSALFLSVLIIMCERKFKGRKQCSFQTKMKGTQNFSIDNNTKFRF